MASLECNHDAISLIFDRKASSGMGSLNQEIFSFQYGVWGNDLV